MSSIHVADGAAQERAKYAEIWSTVPEYRKYSPGLENVERFMSVLEPKVGSTVIDIGCGTGGAGLSLQNDHGLKSWWLDITDAALDPGIERSRFIESPLWAPDWSVKHSGPLQVERRWDYGFCCDVLEHIPTEYAMLTVDRILASCQTAWLQICLVPDEFGKKIGEPLHLTVKPFSWWLVRLATLGTVIDARDLCGNGLYVVTR